MKSAIFIYDLFSLKSLPVRKILTILKPVLLNYQMRDKKFMWVNLMEEMPEYLWKQIIFLHEETIFCQRTSLDKPHTILIPHSIANP